MDFELLKREMKEIVEIANNVPENFRDRCFEILLNRLISETTYTSSDNQANELKPINIGNENAKLISESQDVSVSTPIPLNALLNVFMRKRGVDLEHLTKVLYVEKGADAKNIVHFILEPIATKTPNATSQIRWSLLLALKSNIEKGSDFLIDPEEVRQKCKDKGCYDSKNFFATFTNNKSYFKEVPKPNSSPQSLSDQGQIALADLIKTLSGQAK